ncbi:MAG: hypothetical protein FWE10_04265 [Rikenellaceae bacterium]|nr:hypothetical protein [Rikenellaceae bacterium]MCL2692823.1 hypothetical protein [Rikenellaceae bacterium]
MKSDREYLQKAIDLSRRCEPCSGSYCVGAVIVTQDGREFGGYTHETGAHNHAEEEAVVKAMAAGVSLSGAAMYSSMEPCSKRASKPVSCSQLLMRHGFRKVVYALNEPPLFTECSGDRDLRAAGIEVVVLDEFAEQVREVNRHLLK